MSKTIDQVVANLEVFLLEESNKLLENQKSPESSTVYLGDCLALIDRAAGIREDLKGKTIGG